MDTKELLQIKVKITDKAAMERLKPEMVRAYLSRHKWTPIDEEQPRAVIQYWQGDEWLLVLRSQEVGDYGLRLSAIVRDVALFEQRSELAVYVEILERL